MEGTVKWFSAKNGYGFIETQEGKDVFVHFSAIKGGGYKTLNKGDQVQFDTIDGEKGIQAQNVEVIKPAEPKKFRTSNPDNKKE